MLKDDIIELRNIGYSYSEIQRDLGCSKSTISYHLNSTVKLKIQERSKRSSRVFRKENPLKVKITKFLYNDKRRSYKQNTHSSKSNLRKKIKQFMITTESNKSRNQKMDKIIFHPKDIIEKSNSKCYLTGRDIDFSKPETYSLDHIIPRALGGPNTLENCGLTCSQANYAKDRLSLEEFKQLCLDVVNHFHLK